MAVSSMPVLCPCSAPGKGTEPPPQGLWPLEGISGGARQVSPLGMPIEKVYLLAKENSTKINK